MEDPRVVSIGPRQDVERGGVGASFGLVVEPYFAKVTTAPTNCSPLRW